jgi:hypothetical protein
MQCITPPARAFGPFNEVSLTGWFCVCVWLQHVLTSTVPLRPGDKAPLQLVFQRLKDAPPKLVSDLTHLLQDNPDMRPDLEGLRKLHAWEPSHSRAAFKLDTGDTSEGAPYEAAYLEDLARYVRCRCEKVEELLLDANQEKPQAAGERKVLQRRSACQGAHTFCGAAHVRQLAARTGVYGRTQVLCCGVSMCHLAAAVLNMLHEISCVDLPAFFSWQVLDS